MKYLKQQFGQIGIWTAIITTVGSIFAAGIVGYFSKSGSLSSEIEVIKAAQVSSTLEISQRVTTSEVRVDNLEKKVDEVRSDVKELLRRVK